MNKRTFYIALCIFLGLMLGFLLHTVVEVAIIGQLVISSDIRPFGVTWVNWFRLHALWTVITTVGGVIGGYYLGVTWWRIVYIEKRRWKKFGTKQ